MIIRTPELDAALIPLRAALSALKSGADRFLDVVGGIETAAREQEVRHQFALQRETAQHAATRQQLRDLMLRAPSSQHG